MGGSETRDIECRDIEYRALPSQKRFQESGARFKGFSGPIGSGKSQALCQEAIKLSYAQELNHGYTGVWASVSGSVVTIHARSLGGDGNHYMLDKSTTSSTLTVSISATFSGGHTGVWRTDLTATPRLNRAVRDWNKSFFTALAGYGIDVATAFSTELRDVDPAVGVGMVQRGPGGDAILL